MSFSIDPAQGSADVLSARPTLEGEYSGLSVKGERPRAGEGEGPPRRAFSFPLAVSFLAFAGQLHLPTRGDDSGDDDGYHLTT